MKRGADLVAGLSVAGLMLPEAIAYAGIAGLAPQRAIFAALVGVLAYAVLGRSRFAIVSPTSSSAAVLAGSLAVLTADPAARPMLATILVGAVGLLLLAAGALRLGGLTSFVSRPALRGYAFGLAVTIILKQLPALVGADVHPGDLAQLLLRLVSTPWNPLSLTVGVSALAALVLFRRLRRLPGPLIVLAAGIAGSLAFGFAGRGVAMVGRIDLAFSPFQPAALAWAQAPRLLEACLPLVLILLAESWGSIRTLALQHGDEVGANRELVALGAANLAAGLVQGMPVGAGFSASSANEAAGATSRWAGVVAALGLVVLMAFGVSLVAVLPQPVLAAAVIAALLHALNPAALVKLWRLRRDRVVAFGAVVGVLTLGVLNGLVLAILLSIVDLIRRMSRPRVMRLGQLDGGHDYVDIGRHPEAVAPPGIAVWRPAEPLFFANAERVLDIVAEETPPNVRAVVLSLEESFDLDATALEALLQFDQRLARRGVILRLARVRDAIRDLLTAAGASDLVARTDYSVDDAVRAAGRPAS